MRLSLLQSSASTSTVTPTWLYRECGVRQCRLPINFWVFVLANTACLALNVLVIVTTLMNTSSGRLIQISIQLQQAFTAASFLALAAILAAYTIRFANLPAAQYSRSVLPRRPAVLVSLSTSLVLIFALRAIYETLASSLVWQLRPFPPLLWSHAAFFVLFDLVPLAIALSLTIRIPPPPTKDVAWGAAPSIPFDEGSLQMEPADLLQAALLGTQEDEQGALESGNGRPAQAADKGNHESRTAPGTGGLDQSASGAFPGLSPPMGPAVPNLPHVLSHTSLRSADSTSSAEETRLMLPGSYRYKGMESPTRSMPSAALAGSFVGYPASASSSWGVQHATSSGQAHSWNTRSRLRSTSEDATDAAGQGAGVYDGGQHMLQADRYDVPVQGSLRSMSHRGDSRGSGLAMAALPDTAALRQTPTQGTALDALTLPSPALVIATPSQSGMRTASPHGLSHADAVGSLYEESPSATNLMG